MKKDTNLAEITASMPCLAPSGKFLPAASWSTFLCLILILLTVGLQNGYSQASLPIPAFTGGRDSLPVGFSHSGLGSDYSPAETRLRFDSTGDSLTINFSSAPQELSYIVRGNPAAGTTIEGEFLVEESVDGVSYSPVRSVLNAVNVPTPYVDELSSDSRFVRFTYALKTTGNVGLGTIAISAEPSASAPTITELNPDSGVTGDSVTIVGTNLSSALVTFTTAGGSEEAAITSNSATQIVVTVPAGTITGPLTVVTTEGSASETFFSLNPLTSPYGPETFESGIGSWTTYSVAGNRDWVRLSTSSPTNFFMEINSFNGDVPSNDWLILGPFDFSDASNLTAQFAVQRAFNGDENEMNLKVSSNYSGSGDPSLASWTTVAFSKPATVSSSSAVFSSSGAVTLPPTISGIDGVYIAFHHNPASTNPTSRWRIDNFELFSTTQPLLSVTSTAGSINEGQSATGTVSLPEAVAEDVTITITSADPTELLVDGEGTGATASTTVVIFSGSTSADFSIIAPLDGLVDENQEVQITAEADGYEFGQISILVVNIDLPSAPLTEDGYSQDFSGYNSLESLPLGWSATGPDLTYDGDFGTGTTGGFRGNASVLGYQHTSSTGDLTKILTLRNETGAEINDLTISYVGRLARADQGRSPAYIVSLDGQVIEGLAYSTLTDGDGAIREVSISGLTIAPNQTFSISWASQRGGGGGSSKQIGISNVNISVGASQFPPTLSGVTIPAASIGETGAELNSAVTSDGSAALISRGFLYSVASLNPSPELDGDDVNVVTDPDAQVGPMVATISGLSANTEYAVRSFATNSEGTSYSGVETFSTLQTALPFNGEYTQGFDGFDGTAPQSWTALSSAEVQNYVGDWGTGSSGGFLGGQTDPGVLGYQHTAGTGTLTVTLRLINNTGGELNELFISYLGRVSRIAETRIPIWTVSVDGVVIPELAYSTDNIAGPEGVPGDMVISNTVTGLSIAEGEEFTISWVSDRGGEAGASRQIGLADVVVSTSSPSGEPVISGDLVITGVVGSPITPYQIIASGSPTSYGSGALPDGLVLDEETGIISGIPTGVSTGVIVQISATNGSGTGTADLAINIEPNTATFAAWSGDLEPTPELVEAYAIGGASGPTEAGEAPVVAVEGDNLTLTAIVRTDDPDLTIVGVATSDLSVAFTTTGVTSTTDGVSQDDVPTGTERRKYSVPLEGADKKFLRLVATLDEVGVAF